MMRYLLVLAAALMPVAALGQDRPRLEVHVCTFLPVLGLFSPDPAVQAVVPLRREGLTVDALDSGQKVVASTASGVTVLTGDRTIRIEGDRATFQRGLETLHGGCTDVAARLNELERFRIEIMDP